MLIKRAGATTYYGSQARIKVVGMEILKCEDEEKRITLQRGFCSRFGHNERFFLHAVYHGRKKSRSTANTSRGYHWEALRNKFHLACYGNDTRKIHPSLFLPSNIVLCVANMHKIPVKVFTSDSLVFCYFPFHSPQVSTAF